MAESEVKNSGTDKDYDVHADTPAGEDDERTLEEEELMEGGGDFKNELKDLEQEAEIPVEDLLAMYYPGGTADDDPGDDDDDDTDDSTGEILSSNDLSLDKDEVARDLLPESNHEEKEDLDAIPNRDSDKAVNEEDPVENQSQGDLHVFNGDGLGTHRLLRSASNTGGDDDSDMGSEDSDYVPLDDWKKDINVGSEFQAEVPDGLSPYDDGPVYENEDNLLWDPYKIWDSEVERFLLQVQQFSSNHQDNVSIPTGAHIQDDEKALYILLQCGYNVEEALRRHRMQVVRPTDEMSLWSEEECQNFESGLRSYGKNFYLIHKHKVRTRTVGELVHFYYLWKKTDRHDVFANATRLSKKKYQLHPGITDYMAKFMDDAESVVSPTPGHSILDHSRFNKQPLPPSMNGLEVHNSPEVGGSVTSNLPNETSRSDTVEARLEHINQHLDSSGHYIPPLKKAKLDNQIEDVLLQNIDSLVGPYLDSSLHSLNTHEPAQSHGPLVVDSSKDCKEFVSSTASSVVEIGRITPQSSTGIKPEVQALSS